MKIKIYLDFISFNPSFVRLSSSVKSQKLSEKLILWKKKIPKIFHWDMISPIFNLVARTFYKTWRKKSFWIKLKISHSQRTNGRVNHSIVRKLFIEKDHPRVENLSQLEKGFFFVWTLNEWCCLFYFTQSWLCFSFLKIKTPFSLCIVFRVKTGYKEMLSQDSLG